MTPHDDEQIDLDEMVEVSPGEFKRAGDLMLSETEAVAALCERKAELSHEIAALVLRLRDWAIEHGLQSVPVASEVMEHHRLVEADEPATYAQQQRTVDVLRAQLLELGA
jgi:hypothetical protein